MHNLAWMHNPELGLVRGQEVRQLMGLPAPITQERALWSDSDVPGVTEQLLRAQGVRLYPWAAPNARQAIANPAVFRAVNLLASVGSSLTLEGYRNGARLPLEASPPLVTRPDPFTNARQWTWDTIWSLAYLGEFIWWVGARDPDRRPVGLKVTDPREWTVRWDERRWGRVYEWRGVEQDPRDVIHGTYYRDLSQPRGQGPLQLCGAALSVADQADQWAARFFSSSGVAHVILEHPDELGPEEAQELKDAWASRVPGEPAVVSGGVKATPGGVSPRDATLPETRNASTGDVARMYGINGHLLEYSRGGSSLTYQNVAAIGDELVRFTLAPGYLRPIEVALSDLLTRSTVALYNVDQLLRADIKTRFEVYSSGITSGVLEVPEARAMEGLIPGSSATAAAPLNPATMQEVPQL